MTCVMAVMFGPAQDASAKSITSPENIVSGEFFAEPVSLHQEMPPEPLRMQQGEWSSRMKTVSGRRVWLSPDPIKEDGGLNLYAYVSNDPLNYVDPDGLYETFPEYLGEVGRTFKGVGKGGLSAVSFGLSENIDALKPDPCDEFEQIGSGIGQTAVTVAEVATGAGAIKVAAKKIAAKRLAKSLRKGVCFVAGTQVLTEEGNRAIEEIEAGDRVWSYNYDTEEWELCTVARLLVREYQGEICSIRVGGELIQSTSMHPFWVVSGVSLENRDYPHETFMRPASSLKRGRWVCARELRQGDALLTRNGQRQRVTSIASGSQKVRVYNLSIEKTHNYTVSSSGVLVHNSCGKTGRKINTKRADAIKEKIKKLTESRNQAKTKAEKKQLTKDLKHQRTQLQKSENHAQKGQGN